MIDKFKFVKNFRREFRKKFFFDVTGFVNVFVLMLFSVLFLPLLAWYFKINFLFFLIILQIASMVFTLWVWNEVRKVRKDLS